MHGQTPGGGEDVHYSATTIEALVGMYKYWFGCGDATSDAERLAEIKESVVYAAQLGLPTPEKDKRFEQWLERARRLLQKKNGECATCGGSLAGPGTLEDYAPCPDCLIRFPHVSSPGAWCIYCGQAEASGPCPALNHPVRLWQRVRAKDHKAQGNAI